MNKALVATSTQKILDFLVQHPERQFLAGEIQKATKISKGGANLSLRELATNGLVMRENRGKFFLYSVDPAQPVIKQLKVLRNIELLSPVIAKIKQLSEKVVLFGSSARGEDMPESDIDLFILTNNSREVEKTLKGRKLSRKLQLIVRTPVRFAEMENKEPVFFEEISRGITLWESKE